jgi:integrase/recombinase XerC
LSESALLPGDRHRVVGIDAGAGAVVTRWIAERERIGLPATTPPLSTMRGTRVTTAYVRRLMKSLGRKAGIAKRVHAHGLRHTHAAQLREEGFDIGIISKQLGHRSILTTLRYLDHINPVAVIEAVRSRAWGE